MRRSTKNVYKIRQDPTRRTSRGPRKHADNMRFVRRMLRVLAVASVVYGVRAATEDHQRTSKASSPAFTDVLGCLADRMSPGGCYDSFLSYWNHVEEPLHDKAVKGIYCVLLIFVFFILCFNTLDAITISTIRF